MYLLQTLSVASIVIPTIPTPPCSEHDEEDTEDDDDNDNASNITHKSNIYIYISKHIHYRDAIRHCLSDCIECAALLTTIIVGDEP